MPRAQRTQNATRTRHRIEEEERALRAQIIAQGRVRTLADMSAAEKKAIEKRYHAKIKNDAATKKK
jgi:hypothetical protein